MAKASSPNTHTPRAAAVKKSKKQYRKARAVLAPNVHASLLITPSSPITQPSSAKSCQCATRPLPAPLAARFKALRLNIDAVLADSGCSRQSADVVAMENMVSVLIRCHRTPKVQVPWSRIFLPSIKCLGIKNSLSISDITPFPHNPRRCRPPKRRHVFYSNYKEQK